MSAKPDKRKPIRKRIETPLAQNLRELLKERGITIRAAAELAGVSHAQIHDWCHGVICNNPPALLKLCQSLSCDFQWLLTGVRSKALAEATSPNLAELFQIEEAPQLSGIFMIKTKRLKRRTEKRRIRSTAA